jgi:hypothetical protein
MKIKIPRKIKLGIYTYKIMFDKTMILVDGNVGEHRPNSGVIALAPHMSNAGLYQSFNHEVLHHINSQYKLGLDEDAIDRLATGWAEFMERGLGIQLDWSDIKDNK